MTYYPVILPLLSPPPRFGLGPWLALLQQKRERLQAAERHRHGTVQAGCLMILRRLVHRKRWAAVGCHIEAVGIVKAVHHQASRQRANYFVF